MEQLKDYISVMGLSPRQFAALLGAGAVIGDAGDCDGLFCQRNSFMGTASVTSTLSNEYFNDLLNNQWSEVDIDGRKMYKVTFNVSIKLNCFSHFLSFCRL